MMTENNNRGDDKRQLILDDDDVSASTSSTDSSDMTAVSPSCISGKNPLSKIPASPWPVFVTVVLFFIPIAINSVTQESVLYNKLCYQHFHNLTLCSNKTFTVSHPDLQKEEAMWANYIALLQLPFSIIMNMMLSSYCDKIGHKLPLVLPLIGSALATIYLALLATTQFLVWPMATVLVYPILNTIFGGYPMILMTSFSYVGLVTTPKKRAFYMAIAEGTILFGVLIGQTINGFIIDDFGLDKLSYITAGVSALPAIVALVFVRDAMSTNHHHTWRDVISPSHALDAFRTVYRKRSGHKRTLLNLSFVMYSLPFVTTNAFMSAGFLYFVKQRGLTMTEYSSFSSYTSALKGFGGPFVVYILKRFFKPDQFHMAMGCAVSQVIGYIIMSLDFIPYSMWIGAAFLMTQTSFFALIRSLQTNICTKNELGQLFAFDAIIQCVMSAVTSVLTKEVYTASLSFWPALFLAIGALLFVFAMVVTAIVAYYHDKDKALEVNVKTNSDLASEE